MLTNENVVSFEILDGGSGGIALITLNRAAKKNALNSEVFFGLKSAFEEVKRNAAILAAIITGKGDVFCAGADLAELIPLRTGARQPETLHEREVRDNFELYLDVGLLRGYDVGKPMICAANGAAFAGGFEIFLGCDVRIAPKTAQFGLPEVTVGLIATGGGVSRLPKQCPQAVALEMLMTGAPISAERAYQLGLVNYIVEAKDVLSTAIMIATRIARNSPTAVQATRSCVKLNSGRLESDCLLMEQQAASRVMNHPDAIEGPLAFTQRRKPVWAKL
jgi:enoyl-CoA hydratase